MFKTKSFRVHWSMEESLARDVAYFLNNNRINKEDIIDIKYAGEPLAIAFNYKFVLEFLKIAESEEIVVQLNTPLSATVFAPCSEEDYIYLVMPVQLRG